MHDVDEDSRTISVHGGHQAHGNLAGIALRNLYNNPSVPNVASSNMKNSLIMCIRTMSTKIWGLLLVVVDHGALEARQVSPNEIWAMLLLLLYPVTLLRRTCKIWNYTDWHDVDEDMRTISLQGGCWTESGIGRCHSSRYRYQCYYYIRLCCFYAK